MATVVEPPASTRRSGPAQARQRNRSMRTVGQVSAVLPAVLIVFMFMAYPIGYGAWMSMHAVSLFKLSGGFVGFANYVDLFSRPDFRNALWRTMIFVFALTLHNIPGWARWFRALSLIPFFISSVAVATVWRFLVQSDGGFTSFLSNTLGAESLRWLGDPNLALAVIVGDRVGSGGAVRPAAPLGTANRAEGMHCAVQTVRQHGDRGLRDHLRGDAGHRRRCARRAVRTANSGAG